MDTIPSFSRVEITVDDKQDLVRAAIELRFLAGELDTIAGNSSYDDEAAIIVAHHKIKAASKKLRKVKA